jgi:hypothetical protein
MGLIYPGMPIDLIKSINDVFSPDLFIETGTYLGDSLAEASAIFPTCYSIEIAEELYKRAKERFKDDQNIHLLQGNSAEKLGEIDFSQIKSAFFWLDAHYSGGLTEGEGFCPLVEEVAFIGSLNVDHYIFIDDARFVLSPFQGERYCSIEGLFSTFPENNYNVIINDMIISVPSKAKNIIDDYCLQHTTPSEKKPKIRSKRIRRVVEKLLK